MSKAMKNEKPSWLRLATALSVIWSVLIVGLVANAVFKAPSFEAAAAAPCSQFLVPVFLPVEQALKRIDGRLYVSLISWRDARTREEITPFRRGEQSLSCEVMEQRALIFLMASRAGAITPKVVVHRRRLSALIGIPCCLFVIASYLFLGSKSARASEGPRQKKHGKP